MKISIFKLDYADTLFSNFAIKIVNVVELGS